MLWTGHSSEDVSEPLVYPFHPSGSSPALVPLSTHKGLCGHMFPPGKKKKNHETAKETNNACWNVVIITLSLVSISAELLTCSNSCFWPLGSRKKLVETKIVDALSLNSKSKFKTSKSEMVRMDQSRHQILYDAVSTKHPTWVKPTSHWWIQWMSVF